MTGDIFNSEYFIQGHIDMRQNILIRLNIVSSVKTQTTIVMVNIRRLDMGIKMLGRNCKY